jgi:DNA relaxase NicK
MYIKVDWLSFSVLLDDRSPLDERYTENAVMDALDGLNPMLRDWIGIDASWVRSKGRAPYGIAWQHPTGGITIFYNVTLPHALIEVSGKGCDFLTAKDALNDVMGAVKHRVTRIDLACDILTDTRPVDFAALRDAGRFKSHSHMISESGETFYIGSRTSNRYARVYRYNAPHERAHLLRVEYVVKAQDAKITVQTILDLGERSVAAALGVKFGFTHADWLIDESEAAELASYRPDRHEGKTLYWLSATIAPLLVRLHNEGVTHVEQWFYDNVLNQIRPDNDGRLDVIPF